MRIVPAPMILRIAPTVARQVFCWLGATALLSAVETPDPARWVVPADQPASLPVATASAMAWRMCDAAGREEASGVVTPDASGMGMVAVTPSEGWHACVFADGTSLGLIAGPTAAADPFFAIDVASAWLVADAGRRAALARMVRSLGLAMVRERIAWGRLEPSPDGFDPAMLAQAARVRDDWHAVGLPVLMCFHDAPAWLGRASGAYPADLGATAAAWQRQSMDWPAGAGLEVWNEPDAPMFSGGGAVEHLVALHHALAWAVHAGGDRVQLGGGVLTGSEPAAFRASLWANGIAAASDFISFHDYRDPRGLEDRVAILRAELAAAGDASVPLWISESGDPWAQRPDRPDPRDDLVCAARIAARAVEARACGVARHFAFVLPYYREREVNFGLTGRDGTPLLALAAYAHLARRLAGLDYVGDLPAAAGVRVRVFADASRAVAVACSAGVDAGPGWRPPLPPQAAYACDGRRLAPAADGSLDLDTGVICAAFSPADIAPHLIGDTRASRLLTMARRPRTPRAAPAPLILQPVANTGFRSGVDGWRLDGAGATMAIRAWNLADRDLALRCGISGPGQSGAGDPRPVTVPAHASALVEWPLAAGLVGSWTIVAEGDGASARLVLNTACDPDGSAILSRLAPSHRREIGAAAWAAAAPAAPAGTDCTLSPRDDGSVRLAVRFPPAVDRWAYPRVPIPGGVADADALLARLRCVQPGAVRVMLFVGAAAWFTPGTVVEADGQWHWAVIRFADLQPCLALPPDPHGAFVPAAVSALSIGINADSDAAELDIDRCHLVRLTGP